MTDVNQKAETPLDEALQSVLSDKKYANFFYDTFLNTTVFLPVQREGGQDGTWTELGLKDKFFPYFLTFEKGKALPIFDSLERLKLWSQTKSLDFVKIKAHVLLKIIDPSMSILLNAGTAFSYTLTADILELLRSSMKPVNPV